MEHSGLLSDSLAPNGASASGVGAMAPTQLVTNQSTDGPNFQQHNNRILCPVAGCPESSPSSSRHFRGFASIKNHINSHCTWYLSGAVPVEFLRLYNYSQCPVCGNVIHTRYNGTCPRCRPLLRAQYRSEDFC